VPKDKYEKLLAFVKKIYVQLGSIAEGGMQMPLDEATGATLGFALINFASREEAEKAIAATNNWSFDKAHALKVQFIWACAHVYVGGPDGNVPSTHACCSCPDGIHTHTHRAPWACLLPYPIHIHPPTTTSVCDKAACLIPSTSIHQSQPPLLVMPTRRRHNTNR